MIRIIIDEASYEVKPGKNLLETCIALGIDLPYFCYHPAMGSVGACRQCAVKKFVDIEDKTGKIIMACMEPVTNGMIVSVKDHDVVNFRSSVIEGLMTNHPHDCPICDEGGECHLQDMTVMTGHNYRRFDFKKRTHHNQNLGPFIQHEMNRCIQCYRCVRFYRDYAGGNDLNVFGSADKVYFGRQQDGILESEFSGNLVEVCPTGVFTDKTLKRHYTRKWDLTHTPSLCVHCSLGCNTLLSERYGTIRRVMNRYNGAVNGYFLCDKGRFGYEFLNHPSQIKKILIKNPNREFSEPTDINVSELLADIFIKGRTIGIGSPRASVESNFALQELTGKEMFFHGVSRKEQLLVKKALDILSNSKVHTASLKEIELCDAVLVLGEDVTHTAPVMALALRQAIRNTSFHLAEKLGIPRWNDIGTREIAQDIRNPLYIAHPYPTRLDEVAAEKFYAAPDDIARLGFAIASVLDNNAPEITDAADSMKKLAHRIANSLLAAKRPLIIAGISEGSEAILSAVVNILTALSNKDRNPEVAMVLPECNSAGLSMMNGGSLDDALNSIEEQTADTVIILENDLYRRFSGDKLDAAFNKCRKIIVLDHYMNITAKKADIVLPVASFAGSAGTMVNNECRAQRYYPVIPVNDPVKQPWQWITKLIHVTGGNKDLSWQSFDDIVTSLSNYYPVFAEIKTQLPNAEVRFYNEKIARQTMRFSGRTAINAGISVSEPKPPIDSNSPLNFSMEGYKDKPPANLIPYYWLPGWNSVQAANKYLDEPGGSVKDMDPGVKLTLPETTNAAEFCTDIPMTFSAGKDELLLVPMHRIYGSEELSVYGQAIAELVPLPYMLLNSREINKWKISENNAVNILTNNEEINIQIKIENSIPDGIAAITVLLPGMPWLELPGWGKIIVK